MRVKSVDRLYMLVYYFLHFIIRHCVFPVCNNEAKKGDDDCVTVLVSISSDLLVLINAIVFSIAM